MHSWLFFICFDVHFIKFVSKLPVLDCLFTPKTREVVECFV